MEWHIVVAAVATGISLHSAMEPMNVLAKLERLKNAINTGKIDEVKMSGIDTRPKAYSLGAVVIAVMSAIAYFVINAIDLGVEASLQYSVFVLLVGEFALMAGLDRYHVNIEKITQAQKKSK